ncbi:MAG: FAD-binding protein [Bacteroidetes bacterium]|nr:MAG: FAD-binding protein [Bacteroidota bacterium]
MKPEVLELSLPPEAAADPERVRQKVAEAAGYEPAEVFHFRVLKRSLDARGRRPRFRLRVEVWGREAPPPEPALLSELRDVSDAPEVLIVGAGPAGYFAALELIALGLKPRLFDRGKDVRARRRDLRAIQQFSTVNPDSNYCFGEGGAGTYSDGKLYTRSHKRGDVYKTLKLLVEHGAPSDILVEAHPHIGSNKLPKIVANIRQTILHFGGEIRFEARLTDLLLRDGRLEGIVLDGGEEVRGHSLILATGHSARDVYALLHRRGLRLEAKPFALGVRAEHPQSLIDRIQYGLSPRGPHLPAAAYRLACQVGPRGVFSFCMCPGGLVVPAATAPGEIVVNGMSLSRRDSPFANSGIVVAVEPEDLQPFASHGPFAGLEFQKSVEQSLFAAGDGSQKAPAQRLVDFVEGRLSADLPDSSYIPGLWSAPLHELLPPFIVEKLKPALKRFGRKMRGYYTNEAVLIGTESRTSAPLRIPRDPVMRMSTEVEGLFPCGEGAGYAGGILSAAMDGQNVARAVARRLQEVSLKK